MCNGKLKRIAGLEENNKRKHNICEMGVIDVSENFSGENSENTFLRYTLYTQRHRHINVINMGSVYTGLLRCAIDIEWYSFIFVNDTSCGIVHLPIYLKR